MPGQAYHITQRGTNRQRVFFKDADRSTYLRLLAHNLADAGVRVLAWRLMGNHIHIVGKGDVLMCPSGILLPFILDPLQWIGCETLIAGWLKVHPPVTHPRALRTERERANRTGRSGTTLSY